MDFGGTDRTKNNLVIFVDGILIGRGIIEQAVK